MDPNCPTRINALCIDEYTNWYDCHPHVRRLFDIPNPNYEPLPRIVAVPFEA